MSFNDDLLVNKVLVKNELTKLIWTIKLKYKNKEGGYDIPEPQLATIKTLSDSIHIINGLYELVESRACDLRDARVSLARMSGTLGEHKLEILKLKKQLDF